MTSDSVKSVQSPATSAGDSGAAAAHVLLLPFQSSGHIIPILDLAHQLLARGLTLTIFVIPKNLPLLEPLLATHPYSLEPLVLSPPETSPLPSSSSLVGIIRATSELHRPILQWARAHSNPPVALVSDFFLGWTQRLAAEMGVPRVVFSSSGAKACAVFTAVWRDMPKNEDPGQSPDFMVRFPKIAKSPVYPWRQLNYLYRAYKEGDPDGEFFKEGVLRNVASWGVVFNTFRGLEQAHIDQLKEEGEYGGRVWAVGPLLPPDEEDPGPGRRGGVSSVSAHEVLTWLDGLRDASVVYVCFGSWHVLERAQMDALAGALEVCGAHFVWCVRSPTTDSNNDGVAAAIPDGFEKRVGGRGLLIRGWAPQVAILRHRAVGAFLTHCGWNSTLEGISAGVVMLTWPMGVDQFTNAALLVDELGVGIRVAEESREIPEPAEFARILDESVDEKRPQRARTMDLRKEASEAAAKGGSSSRDLDSLVKAFGQLKAKEVMI